MATKKACLFYKKGQLMKEKFIEYENINSMLKILTIESLSVVRDGDIVRACKFTESGEFQDFQQYAIKEGYEYARLTYQYSCAAFYTSIIMGNTPLSSAVKLMSEFTAVKYNTSEEYISALPELLMSFTKLAATYSNTQFRSIYLNKAAQFIQDNIYDTIDPVDLCRYCGCSISYLRNLFKAETKQTLNEFINTCKISKACEMLKKGSMTINQISAQLGFSSESYFIVLFKKYKGMTPGQYKQLEIDRNGKEGHAHAWFIL